ncbi:MAG: helix-turn-helix domain-containing protein [Synergistaceae bacterium]|jgi:transcriptional regulator with XRE-family HTH domain|nr:helix-turn-helix domain-containing protein [Synergistaceae bacterium]
MNLGELLRELRKARKLTQKQVALGTGKTERHYQDVEYGKAQPSLEYIVALADFFSFSIDEVMGRKQADATSEQGSSGDIYELPTLSIDRNPAEKLYLVYVSAVCLSDLEQDETIRALLEIDCIPVGMLRSCQTDAVTTSLIRNAIDESDYHLLIIGTNRASYDYVISSKHELRCVCMSKKPRAIFVQKQDGGKSSADAATILEVLCGADTENIEPWTSAADLGNAVSRRVSRLKKHFPTSGWTRGEAIINKGQIARKNFLSRVEAMESRIKEFETLMVSYRQTDTLKDEAREKPTN